MTGAAGGYNIVTMQRADTQYNLRLPANLVRKIKAAAAEEGARRGEPITVAQWVREKLEAAVGK